MEKDFRWLTNRWKRESWNLADQGGAHRLYPGVVKEMFQNSLSIRCGGSAALGLCRGASGSNTVYLELKLQPYDYAAASVILEEAGGKITQIDGSPITLHEGCSIIGGTPAAWQESKEAFEKLKEEM